MLLSYGQISSLLQTVIGCKEGLKLSNLANYRHATEIFNLIFKFCNQTSDFKCVGLTVSFLLLTITTRILVCLHEISFRAKWNVFVSVSGQSLVTIYMGTSRSETYCGSYFIAVILREMKFHFGDKISCKYYPKWNYMKGNICTCVKKIDWNLRNGTFISHHPRNEIHLISPAMKSKVNRICFMVGWNFVSGRFHFGSHVNNL